MSYQIYYDRAYIKVNDKFIPLICSGSNNCWEYSFISGRDVPEKNWNVLNYRCRSKLLFTKNEINEQAERYEEISINSGTCFKTRYQCFKKGEFERWIINGMRNAHTIEEYVECGNTLYIRNDDEADKSKIMLQFTSTEEFLELLSSLKSSKNLDVEFGNNRKVFKPIIPSKAFELKQNGNYYVLKSARYRDSYFCSIRKRTIKYTNNPYGYAVRAFVTKDDAEQYLEKYKDRLGRFEFSVELIGSDDAERLKWA